MKPPTGTELRVVKGLHHGARAALAEGTYVLGSSLECDFILCDEGIQNKHAELRHQEGGYVVCRYDGQNAGPAILQLRHGQGVALGHAVVALYAANSPWRDDPELLSIDALAADPEAANQEGDPLQNGSGRGRVEPTLSGSAAANHDGTELQPINMPDAAVVPAPTSGNRDGSEARLLKTAVTAKNSPWVKHAIVTAGVILIGIGWAWLGRSGPAVPSEGLDTVPKQPPADASLEIDQGSRIQQVLNDLDFSPRARVSRAPRGTWVVESAELTDDETLMLADSLNRQGLRPSLRILGSDEVTQNIRAALMGYSAKTGASLLDAHYGGEGRFVISGRVETEAQKAELLSSLAADFPLAKGFDSRLIVPQEVAIQMIKALQADSELDVNGEWRDGEVAMKVRLGNHERQLWEDSLARVSRRFDLPFRAELELTSAAPKRTGQTLPFTILSVVSGPTPYVVLGDGNKILLDGVRDGWRLSDVAADRVEFAGSGGRKLTIAR